MIRRAFHITYKAARRIVIGIVGATVLLTGVVMLVTPGPALVVIPVGLAILSIANARSATSEPQKKGAGDPAPQRLRLGGMPQDLAVLWRRTLSDALSGEARRLSGGRDSRQARHRRGYRAGPTLDLRPA